MNCRQTGVTLIEVLVSIVIFSIGLLGLAAMQLHSLQFNQGASVRGHAVFLAYEMADRIRARPANAPLAGYALTPCAPAEDTSEHAPEGEAAEDGEEVEGCSASTKTDHVDWLANLARQLPGGAGSVEVDGARVTITVQWDDSRVGGADNQTISIVTRI